MSPLLTGFAFGGAAGIPKATYTATTGSPTIDTSTRAGKTIIKYTGSGSITIGVAGTCEILLVGGGGGGTGAGAGGVVYNTSAILPAGTLTVTLGTGGTNSTYPVGVGLPSAIGSGSTQYIALGGTNTNGVTSASNLNISGGSTAGTFGYSGGFNKVPGNALFSQGNLGGQGGTYNSGNGGQGGGGGAGSAGSVGGANNGLGDANGGSGGTGLSVPITGTSITYAAGGGGSGVGGGTQGTPTGNGTANTGNGGGGNGGGIGGLGYVVIVLG